MPHWIAFAFAAALIALPVSASAQTTTIIEVQGPLSIEEAREIARAQGIRRFHKIELDRGEGDWEIDGTDLEGRYVEMDIDANTGAILRIDR